MVEGAGVEAAAVTFPPFCDDPKLKPVLAVVAGATEFPLKLNPIPLAVVVSGF